MSGYLATLFKIKISYKSSIVVQKSCHLIFYFFHYFFYFCPVPAVLVPAPVALSQLNPVPQHGINERLAALTPLVSLTDTVSF